MNSFAFESGGKRSIALDSSHIDRTSEEIVLRDTDGEKDQIISSKKQKVFPAKLKILHRRNQFHRQNHFNRFDNALISPISSKYNVNASFDFIRLAFLERRISFVFPSSRIS